MVEAIALATNVEALERGRYRRRRYSLELGRRITNHAREKRATGVPLLRPSRPARRCSTDGPFLLLDIEHHADGKEAGAAPGNQMH